VRVEVCPIEATADRIADALAEAGWTEQDLEAAEPGLLVRMLLDDLMGKPVSVGGLPLRRKATAALVTGS
jgi:hypothetical protein